jgi:hypothetical protein
MRCGRIWHEALRRSCWGYLHSHLLAARYRGLRTVEIEGCRVTYATDAEMAAAITDLERRIATAANGGRRRRILTSASKGL